MHISLKQKFVVLMVLVFALAVAVPAFAQEDPTIDIDMSGLFQQINYWAGVLFPVLSIGFAIMIAIAIITFVGRSIVSAFRGGGG